MTNLWAMKVFKPWSEKFCANAPFIGIDEYGVDNDYSVLSKAKRQSLFSNLKSRSPKKRQWNRIKRFFDEFYDEMGEEDIVVIGTGKVGKFYVDSIVILADDAVDFIPTSDVDDIRHRRVVDILWKAAPGVQIEAPWGWANRLEKLDTIQHYQQFLTLLAKVHLTSLQTSPCHFEPGNKNEISVVLSCPGNKEVSAGHPAAGITGKNIGIFFDELDKKSNLSWARNDITITNSWSKPESNSLTGRTEPTEKEVLNQKNLIRLYKEIQHTTNVIVVFGKNAKAAIQELIKQGLISSSIQIIEMPHLSTRFLNANVTSNETDSEKRNIDRIQQLIKLNNITV